MQKEDAVSCGVVFFHRMICVERDPWTSSCPASLLKQSLLAHVLCPDDFRVSPEKRLYNLSGEPVPVLNYPHSKEILSQMELPVFQFLLIASHPAAWHHQEESDLILFTFFPSNR